jgi:hypothetical protein
LLNLPNGWWIAAIAVIGFVVVIRRQTRDLREYLEPPLQQCGMQYESSVSPGMFRVGPFPFIEGEIGRPQSNIGGIRGEHSEYKIVNFRDVNGRSYQIWAKVEFEAFQFRRVRWRAKVKQGLPESILAILEN